MRFHIVGAVGPMGTLISYHLRRIISPSDTITIIRRNSRQMREFNEAGASLAITRDGIRHKEFGFKCQIPNPSLSLSPTTRTITEDTIDSLIVASRTYSTLSMLRMLSPRLTSSSTVVLFQTGMGIYESLIQKIFTVPEMRPHFIIASNSHQVYNKGLGDAIHARFGEITFSVIPNRFIPNLESGFYDPKVSPFERKGRLSDLMPIANSVRYQGLHDTVQALLRLELNTSWVSMDELEITLCKDLVVRSVVDPLTSLMNCRNGQVLESQGGEQFSDTICREAARVFEAQRHARPEGAIRTLPRELHADELQKAVVEYVAQTKGSISKMLTDIRLGKPTEIRYLNGHLVMLGQAHKVYVGQNRMLWHMVNMRSEIPLDLTLY